MWLKQLSHRSQNDKKLQARKNRKRMMPSSLVKEASINYLWKRRRLQSLLQLFNHKHLQNLNNSGKLFIFLRINWLLEVDLRRKSVKSKSCKRNDYQDKAVSGPQRKELIRFPVQEVLTWKELIVPWWRRQTSWSPKIQMTKEFWSQKCLRRNKFWKVKSLLTNILLLLRSLKMILLIVLQN